MVTYMVVLALAGCGTQAPNEAPPPPSEINNTDVVLDIDGPRAAAATLAPTAGNEARGTVLFRQEDGAVAVQVDIVGLEPSSRHGFHVHEKGDCTAPDGSSAGGHYSPDGNAHALPQQDKRHAGDMGNLVADARGEVHTTLRFQRFSVSDEAPVLHRAVVLHEGADQGTQPSGDAGSRIACGVITTAG